MGRGVMNKKVFKLLAVLCAALLFMNGAFAAVPAPANNYQYTNPNSYSENSNSNLAGYIMHVPAGKTIEAILSQDINSKSAVSGAIVNAILIEDLRYQNTLIASCGSIVQGTITKAKKAPYSGKNARIEIRFTSIITPYNNVIPISAVLAEDSFKDMDKAERLSLFANTKIKIYFDQPITLGAQ